MTHAGTTMIDFSAVQSDSFVIPRSLQQAALVVETTVVTLPEPSGVAFDFRRWK
jgi:hypothetical protein